MSSKLSGFEGVVDALRRPRETPLVLCVDVEPDARVFDPADPTAWEGFERLMEELPALRERLSQTTGQPARFTWPLRMDPQVAEGWGTPTWIADTHGDALAELVEAGDELALHTHAWRWHDGDWVADFEDAAWGEHCLAMGLDAYEEAFGRPCTTHRAGDRFLNGPMVACMQQRGVRLDLTPEPGLPPLGGGAGEEARGSSPDYRRIPTRPYRSSPDAFPAAEPGATGGPLIVPLASARRRRPPFRRFPLWLWEPGSAFGPRFATELLRKPPVVALSLRSDTPLDPVIWDLVRGRLEHLARYRGIVFKTASEAAEAAVDPAFPETT